MEKPKVLRLKCSNSTKASRCMKEPLPQKPPYDPPSALSVGKQIKDLNYN